MSCLSQNSKQSLKRDMRLKYIIGERVKIYKINSIQIWIGVNLLVHPPSALVPRVSVVFRVISVSFKDGSSREISDNMLMSDSASSPSSTSDSKIRSKTSSVLNLAAIVFWHVSMNKWMSVMIENLCTIYLRIYLPAIFFSHVYVIARGCLFWLQFAVISVEQPLSNFYSIA